MKLRNVQYWVGISTYMILTRIAQMEHQLMATLEEIVTEVGTLTTNTAAILAIVRDLEAAAPGTLTPEQQAQIDAADTAIDAVNAALEAAVAEAPATTATPDTAEGGA